MNVRWKIAQSAEIRWWKNYLKNKPKADYLDWKEKYWNDFLQKSKVSPQVTDTILDAGCGPAGIFMIFPQHQVDAVDPLLDSYESELHHFVPANYPNVRFHSNALENYQPDKKYDLVFCLNAINHVADLDLCFDKIVQFTKPNGKLIVSIDAHNYSGFKHVFRLLPGDILHPHQFDLKEYKQMLQKRDCIIEETILMKKEFFFDYYTIVATKK